MNQCKSCHDEIAEWNIRTNSSDVCYFCFFEIDDDDKQLAYWNAGFDPAGYARYLS